jgi:hypothetical protein
MARNEDALSGKVHVAIALVRRSGCSVGVAKITKNTKRQVVRVCVMKSEV